MWVRVCVCACGSGGSVFALKSSPVERRPACVCEEGGGAGVCGLRERGRKRRC